MFLTIKNIPKVSWSSNQPLNLKPKSSTFIYLCFGLILFGIGEGLLLVSYTGASPWSVLAQGISNYVDLSIGTITFFISLFVIFLWVFLNQKPGIGTFLNVIIIAVMIDVCLNYVPTPESLQLKIFLAIFAVIITGIGSGIYLIANLGPGPRDGLMTGIQKKTNLPIASVRAFLEISVVTIGWYLGGTVGIGTLLFAFGIGPCVAFGLYIVDKISTKK